MSSTYLGTAAFGPLGRFLLKTYGFKTLLYVEGGMTLLLFPLAFMFVPRTAQEAERQDISLSKLIRNLKRPLQRRKFVFWLVLMSVQFFSYYTPIVHTIRYAEDVLHISPDKTGYLLTCYALAAALSAFFFSWIGSHVQSLMSCQMIPILIGGVGCLFFPL
eukprot:m.61929 g.61929  ORF g.61929 m.61929 type:complete len:161 (+) comp35026_c0_seq1:315-797(+)